MTITDSDIQHYIHRYMPDMDGWCSAEKAEALKDVVMTSKPKLAVEIGVYGGRSLIAIALSLKAVGEGGYVIGIDPWDAEVSAQGFPEGDENRKWWARLNHSDVMHRCERHIGFNKVGEQVTLLRLTSNEAHRVLGTAKEPFIDLLHIDGNHSEECSVADVEHYVPFVRPGGVVVFDDTNWGTTKHAQEILSELCNFSHFVETPGQQCGFYVRK